MAHPQKAITLALAAFLFGSTVYRAVTLSVTVDEAYTYTQFVLPPALAGAGEYDANNHVLHTLLVKLSTRALGASDVTLRLPALAGAALFFTALYRMLVQLAGPGSWWLPLGYALAGGNTLIGDLLPLARGYGLALGLFTLGLSLLLDDERRRRQWAGVALGLSVAANLTLAFPVCGLLAGVLWLDRRAGIGTAAIAAGSAAALLAVPMRNAMGATFYFGADSLLVSLRSLVGGSLTRNLSEAGGPVPAGIAAMAAVLIATVVIGVWRGRNDRALFLMAASIGMGLALVAAAHYGAGFPYPHGRTGLAWILLTAVALAGLAVRFRAVAVLAAPVGLAALFCYGQAWSTAATIAWEWDAGTRSIAEVIAARTRPPGRGVVRVGSSGPMSHTLNYYRVTRGWDWMADVTRDDIRQGRYDYYAVFGDDRAWVESQAMTVLYEHPVARSILAVPGPGR